MRLPLLSMMLVLSVLSYAHSQVDRAATTSAQLAEMHLLVGPWLGGTIYRESVLVRRDASGKSFANLLYDADKILEIQSPDRSRAYELNVDYTPLPDGSGISAPDKTRMPRLGESELFRPKGSPKSIGHRVGDPETSVLFDNGKFFHDYQVEVTYVAREPKWDAYKPAFAGEALSRTITKLTNKQPITVAVSGDSISEGYNASAHSKTEPFQPAYPGLFTAQLQQTYGTNVTLQNRSVGGWSSAQGVGDLDKLLATKPDLVIIAYGMNDVGSRKPDVFKANIAIMLKRIQEANPEIDVILVATMTGNPDWMATPPEMFPVYRDVLASFQGKGVAMVDMTSIWQRLLKRKWHLDLTGNGVNHPNDCGHRIYAQAILTLLVDPDRIAKAEPAGK